MRAAPSASAARFARRCALACTAGALLLAAVNDARATRDRPPTAHTGGFGEPSCHACHFEHEPNSGNGRALLRGVPEQFRPGAAYAVTILVTRPGLATAGFELSVRFDSGAQAGTLSAGPRYEKRLDITTDRGVQYAHHLADGTLPALADTARWVLVWRAPDEPGRVTFHLAGNAANDDSSPLGDFVYLASAQAIAAKEPR